MHFYLELGSSLLELISLTTIPDSLQHFNKLFLFLNGLFYTPYLLSVAQVISQSYLKIINAEKKINPNPCFCLFTKVNYKMYKTSLIPNI